MTTSDPPSPPSLVTPTEQTPQTLPLSQLRLDAGAPTLPVELYRLILDQLLPPMLWGFRRRRFALLRLLSQVNRDWAELAQKELHKHPMFLSDTPMNKYKRLQLAGPTKKMEVESLRLELGYDWMNELALEGEFAGTKELWIYKDGGGSDHPDWLRILLPKLEVLIILRWMRDFTFLNDAYSSKTLHTFTFADLRITEEDEDAVLGLPIIQDCLGLRNLLLLRWALDSPYKWARFIFGLEKLGPRIESFVLDRRPLPCYADQVFQHHGKDVNFGCKEVLSLFTSLRYLDISIQRSWPLLNHLEMLPSTVPLTSLRIRYMYIRQWDEPLQLDEDEDDLNEYNERPPSVEERLEHLKSILAAVEVWPACLNRLKRLIIPSESTWKTEEEQEYEEVEELTEEEEVTLALETAKTREELMRACEKRGVKLLEKATKACFTRTALEKSVHEIRAEIDLLGTY